ncbi:MAG: hypothetical protein IPL93_07870 [Actinomycetales bacterium]|jgi:hypothetical protein|nr:hypothetical protein [Actinomycetales bacterium]
MSDSRGTAAALEVDFAGEVFHVLPGHEFVIGRQGDLALDDNPFLHRRFITLTHTNGLWWVSNVGSRLCVSMSDGSGLMRTVLGPGARLPVVFPLVLVTFSAGPTAYEIRLTTHVQGFAATEAGVTAAAGESTVGPDRFTASQRLLMLALAEPVLLRAGSGASRIPASADAASRLGWTITRFNRKLDNVCDKLTRAGVRGLRGQGGDQATNRRAALVEYAVGSLLVRVEDLPLLDVELRANRTATQRIPEGAQGAPVLSLSSQARPR